MFSSTAFPSTSVSTSPFKNPCFEAQLPFSISPIRKPSVSIICPFSIAGKTSAGSSKGFIPKLKPIVSSIHAKIKFITTPAIITKNLFRPDCAIKLRLFFRNEALVESSPSILTNPPKGIQFRE